MEVKGALAHIDLSQLPDHLLQRIANGEHPLAVLASAVPVDAEGRPVVAALPAGEGAGGGAGTGEIVVEERAGEAGELASKIERGEGATSHQATDPPTDRPPTALGPPAP